MSDQHYDLLVQMDEILLNKALAALYYSGFLTLEGEYNFVDGIPESLHDFTKFSYKIRMKNEPLIDLRGRDQVYIKFAVELKLIVLTGIILEFDASFQADSKIRFDAISKKLTFDLSSAQITNLYINDTYRFHKKFIDNINEVLAVILTVYLTEDRKTIEIPLVLEQLALPEMPAGDAYQLPVRLGDVFVYNNHLLAIGINFFEDTAEEIVAVDDMSGSELYVSLKENTLKQVFDFWWDNTQYDKSQEFSGSLPLKAEDIFEKSTDFLSRLVTLGLIETHTDYKNLWLAYEGQVRILEKPEFEFQEDNKVLIHALNVAASLKTAFSAEVKKDILVDTSLFIPDKITPWEDDRLIKHSEGCKEILKLEHEAKLYINQAEGTLKLNESNNLVIDIVKADFTLEFGDKWYDNLSEKAINAIIDLFEKKIIDKIPNLVVSPSMLLSKFEAGGYTLQMSAHHLSFDNDRLTLAADIGVNELMSKGVPVPAYIGNKRSRRIHHFSCTSIEDIEMENRIGFYVLYEALKEGYTTCKSCLGAGQVV